MTYSNQTLHDFYTVGHVPGLAEIFVTRDLFSAANLLMPYSELGCQLISKVWRAWFKR